MEKDISFSIVIRFILDELDLFSMVLDLF